MIGDFLGLFLPDVWPYLLAAAAFIAGFFGIRWDAKRDARREMKNKATEDALRRERERDEIADGIDVDSAADRLRDEWSE